MDKLRDLNLLFLEDNEGFAKNTIEFLEMYFKNVIHSASLKEALNIFNDSRIDVIISDLIVEDGNGLDFITKIRELDENVPIVILSAYKDEDFLFKAIPMNITAYELKPISYENFIALLNKIVQKLEIKDIINIASQLDYSFKTKELFLDKESVKLGKKEILFIELMINYIGEVVTNDMIQRNVWEDNVMSDSAIKNFILRLRKKIQKDVIKTIQGVGYKLAK